VLVINNLKTLSAYKFRNKLHSPPPPSPLMVRTCHSCLSIHLVQRNGCLNGERLVCPTGDRENGHKTNRKYRARQTPSPARRRQVILLENTLVCDPGACYRPPGIKFAFWKHKKKGVQKIDEEEKCRGGVHTRYLYCVPGVYVYNFKRAQKLIL